MRIEPKQAFYNEATGAVQPWKDIEVTDAVGNELVAEGLVTEIEGGGGGSIETAEVTFVNAATDGSHYAVLLSFQTTPITVSSDPVTVELPLYGEDAVYFLWGSLIAGTLDPSFPPEMTGSISLSDDGDFTITGDGTLTVKSIDDGGIA